MKRTLVRALFITLLVAQFAECRVQAGLIDLTQTGSYGEVNGGLFKQADPQPTGTGILDPFVRLQMTGIERGYNTDARPVEFDTKDQNQWTHSLNLSSLALLTIDGKGYYKFTLDINEQGNPSGQLLSLDSLAIHLGDSPSLTGYNNGFGSHSVDVFNLDATDNSTIALNSKLNHGSGSGDMFAYIPANAFSGFDSKFQWVYLYSMFGATYASDGGFEEWAATTKRAGPPDVPPVPTPRELVLTLIGLGCVAARYLLCRLPAMVG